MIAIENGGVISVGGGTGPWGEDVVGEIYQLESQNGTWNNLTALSKPRRGMVAVLVPEEYLPTTPTTTTTPKPQNPVL